MSKNKSIKILQQLVGGENVQNELTQMTESDQYVLDVLTNPDIFIKHFESWVADTAKRKHYQTVIFWDLDLGVIIHEQSELVAIFDTANPLFGKFVAENRIKMKPACTSKVEPYSYVKISYYDAVQQVTVSRSLAKLLIFSKGEELVNGDEAHHEQHAMINTINTVEGVPKSNNAGKKPNLTTYSEAIEFIKTEVLKTDDSGFEKLLSNCKLITQAYPKKRGIYVEGVNPIEVVMDNDMLKDGSISLSKL